MLLEVSAATEQMGTTRGLTLAGTFAYMAPEVYKVATGNPMDPVAAIIAASQLAKDPACDIWSLGAVTMEMIMRPGTGGAKLEPGNYAVVSTTHAVAAYIHTTVFDCPQDWREDLTQLQSDRNMEFFAEFGRMSDADYCISMWQCKGVYVPCSACQCAQQDFQVSSQVCCSHVPPTVRTCGQGTADM
jgi:serine/threonine protein kinase